VDANERNAVILVSNNGKDVLEVFRNAPDATTKLRNAGPLEFNTSPVLTDRKFCTANADVNRRDNSPAPPAKSAPPDHFKARSPARIARRRSRA
jgi:hypothetical protein